VAPTSLLASFAANIVHSRLKAHRASVMGCISVQGAVWKGVLALVGDLWNPCSAGPCKFYVAIIIGLCARSKLAGLTNLTRSRTGEFYLSAIVHHICTLNRLTHSSGILNNNVTSVFEAGIAIQQWRAEVNKVRFVILRHLTARFGKTSCPGWFSMLRQPSAASCGTKCRYPALQGMS
jgi:hypothetical protein